MKNKSGTVRKQNRWKQIFAAGLAGLLCMGLLSGCGGGEEEAMALPTVYPASDEEIAAITVPEGTTVTLETTRQYIYEGLENANELVKAYAADLLAERIEVEVSDEEESTAEAGSQPESGASESSEEETSKPESGASESSEEETSKPESGASESGEEETSQPESGASESGKEETSEPESGASESGKKETSEPESGASESSEGEKTTKTITLRYFFVNDNFEEVEMPDFSAETGSAHLARATGKGDEIISLRAEWAPTRCAITVGLAHGAIKELPPKENNSVYTNPYLTPMTELEAIDYVASLEPGQLGLEGESMEEYSVYSMTGSVMINDEPCMQIRVFSKDNPAGTNAVEATFLIDGVGNLYRIEESTGEVSRVLDKE